MAGAGYDIGASAAQSSNYSFGTPYVSNVLFSGSKLEGGSAVTEFRDTADATATSKSPGAVNSKQVNDSGGSLAASDSNPNKTLILIGLGVLAFLALKK